MDIGGGRWINAFPRNSVGTLFRGGQDLDRAIYSTLGHAWYNATDPLNVNQSTSIGFFTPPPPLTFTPKGEPTW